MRFLNRFGFLILTIVACILFVLLQRYDKQLKHKTAELFMPHIKELTALKEVSEKSRLATHSGSIVIIDYEKEELSEYYLSETGIFSSTEVWYDLPRGLIAQTPDDVRTVVFLKETPAQWVASYSGGISIMSVNKRESLANDPLFRCYKSNGGAISIYAEATELSIVDRQSGLLIETLTFNSVTRDPLPKNASCCVKVLGDYQFSSDHSGPLVYANQQSCGLLFRYWKQTKREMIWDAIKSNFNSHIPRR